MKPARPVATRGLMLVLSSPSGAGKSTISRAVLEREENITLSVSLTTRPPRKGEVKAAITFSWMTPRSRRWSGGTASSNMPRSSGTATAPRARPSKRRSSRGATCCSTSTGRARSRLPRRPGPTWSAFSCSRRPSRSWSGACTPAPKTVPRWCARAWPKALDEVSHYAEYDYVVINSDLETSIEEVRSILRAERRRRTRQTGLTDFVNLLRGERR